MKIVEVTIQHTTALLLCRFTEKAEMPKGHRPVLIKRGTPREQAENASYKTKDGEYFFPGPAIQKLLRESGSGHKLTGSRKSAKYIVSAACLVLQEAIVILGPDGKPATDFEVDSRPVVIPATKGRIMCHRPRWDEWGAVFTLRINDDLLPVEFVNQLLVEGALQLGIGAFRPEKGGPFGTFMVTKFAELKDPGTSNGPPRRSKLPVVGKLV
jgi:hypothetical protein